MGSIVRDASPYLFPLMIEYSLIGAAVLYIMWQNIGRCPRYLEEDDIPDHVSVTSRKAHTKVGPSAVLGRYPRPPQAALPKSSRWPPPCPPGLRPAPRCPSDIGESFGEGSPNSVLNISSNISSMGKG